MKVRKLNERGIEEFKHFLESLRLPLLKEEYRSRDEILESEEFTEPFEADIDLPEKKFTLRKEFTEEFQKFFGELDSSLFLGNRGFWSWLSLFYIDSVCPEETRQQEVGAHERFILDTSTRKHSSHRLYVSWNISHLARQYDVEKYAEIWLNRKLSELGSFTAETMKRLYLTRLPCFFELVYKLYWDEAKQRIRSNVLNTGKDEIYRGDLTHRLPNVLSQLAVNYDLHNLTADQLIRLLGEEFTPENIGRKP